MEEEDYCKNINLCPDGNCIGCKNREIWCYDPRCEPFCPGNQCRPPKGHDDNVGLIIIILIMLIITLIVLVIFTQKEN